MRSKRESVGFFGVYRFYQNFSRMKEPAVEHDQGGEQITQFIAAADVFSSRVFETILKPAAFWGPGGNVRDRQSDTAVANFARLVKVITTQTGQNNIDADIKNQTNQKSREKIFQQFSMCE